MPGIFARFRKPQTALPLPVTEPAEEERVSPELYGGEQVFGGLAWYRAQYYRAVKLCFVLGGGLAVSAGIIGVLLYARPAPQFFAATPDLRLAPLVPLDKPVLTQQGLLNWVSETITGAVSLDFLEWR